MNWKNLDTIAAFEKLNGLKGHVNLQEAMSGESGADRVRKYRVPMAAGLTYHYAAKQVDEEILKRAVAKTTKRHPYFCVKLVMEGDDIYFEDNENPMPVLHTDGPVTLGGEQVDEHLMSISWWKTQKAM